MTTVGHSLPARLLQTARAGNWWSSKLPPLLAVAFAQVLRRSVPAAEAAPALAAVIVALCAVAWHAHVVNDLCDIEDDARSGKPNRMADASSPRRWTLLIALPITGFLAAASLLVDATMPLVVLGANFLVFALYSVPPIRLKKRRWLGAIADASAAHAIPTLFVLSAMPGGVGTTPSDRLFAGAAIVVALAVGLRGIIMHQFEDRRADELAQLRTVGTTMPVTAGRMLVRRVLLPIEGAALIVLVGVLVPRAPLLLVAAVLFVAAELAKVRRRWTLPQFELANRTHERYVPLVNNDAYELWLPTVLALQLASRAPCFVPLPLLLLALFHRGMRPRATALMALMRDEPEGRPAAAGRSGPHLTRRSGKVRGVGSRRPQETSALLGAANIIVSSPCWARNGVNLHSLRLVRGLAKRGLRARLLLTEEETELVSVSDPRLDLPSDVPMDRLPVARAAGWGAHWGATVRYLEAHAPCVFLPTYDWRHACVVPRLSSRVQVVADVARGDALTQEQAQRLAPHLSAIVTRDAETTVAWASSNPEAADLLVLIPPGIAMPDEAPVAAPRRPVDAILVSTSAFDGWQDALADVLGAMSERGMAPRVALLPDADHPERGLATILDSIAPASERVYLPVAESVYAGHVAIVAWLSSDHVPTELVEAMGGGCIPFVIDRAGRTHAMFRSGENCFVFEPGDAAGIADRLIELGSQSGVRSSMSGAARESARAWFTSFETELDHYVALFGALLDPARPEHCRRSLGDILPPPASVAGIDVFPVSLEHRVAGIGPFPTLRDFEEYVRVAGRARHGAPGDPTS